MSSHHFVREGQEPALFVVDPIAFRFVGPLLEWAPLVVVSDDALDDILHWGIKIDIVLAKAEREEILIQKLSGQDPVSLFLYESEGTLIRNGMQYLKQHNQEAVNITSIAWDNVISQVAEFTGTLQINVLDEQRKWSGVTSGTFEKWLPAHTNLWIRKSLESQSVQFQGLTKKNGNFEAKTNGSVCLRSDHLFWVGEEHF